MLVIFSEEVCEVIWQPFTLTVLVVNIQFIYKHISYMLKLSVNLKYLIYSSIIRNKSLLLKHKDQFMVLWCSVSSLQFMKQLLVRLCGLTFCCTFSVVA